MTLRFTSPQTPAERVMLNAVKHLLKNVFFGSFAALRMTRSAWDDALGMDGMTRWT